MKEFGLKCFGVSKMNAWKDSINQEDAFGSSKEGLCGIIENDNFALL